MNLEQALIPHLGRSVEVYAANNFLQGTLLGVSGGIVAVNAVSSVYSAEAGPVNVPIANIEYIRVLVA